MSCLVIIYHTPVVALPRSTHRSMQTQTHYKRLQGLAYKQPYSLIFFPPPFMLNQGKTISFTPVHGHVHRKNSATCQNILHLVQWKSTLKKTMTFFFHPLMCGRAFHFFWCVAAFHLLLEKQTKNKLYVMLTRNPIGDFLFKKLYYSLFCVLTSTVYFSVTDAGVDRGYTMRQALKITFNSSSI